MYIYIDIHIYRYVSLHVSTHARVSTSDARVCSTQLNPRMQRLSLVKKVRIENRREKKKYDRERGRLRDMERKDLLKSLCRQDSIGLPH